MRNMKRISIFLLALITASMMLFACGSSPGKAKDDAGGQTAKEITITVVHGDKTEKKFEVETSAETLGEVLRDENIAEGEEASTGMYVQTADGETADESKQEWWSVSVNGEMAMVGVDEQKIADGDEYELALTTGYN